MPSTKKPVDEMMYFPRLIPIEPKVKQAEEKAVVSYEQWIENEEDYLLHIYEHIQSMNHQSGRQIFDNATCDFPKFCRVCYTYSFKYKKKDAYIYEENDQNDQNDLAYENAEAYVFE